MRTTLIAIALGLVFCASTTLLPAAVEPLDDGGRGIVAVQAGTIHVVEDGQVLEGGTILIKNGRILAVGDDVEVPIDAHVVDYGPDAVIVPGLVAADSGLGSGFASVRTADPDVRAIENFDFYAKQAGTLAGGVTTAYVSPSSGRLIGGTGAVVKLAGDDEAHRTLSAANALDGAIHSGARNTAGYWDPPVPATVDVGLGYAEPQLPKSTMGAILALERLIAAARAGGIDEHFGPYAVMDLAAALEAGLPWRIGARTEIEIRALLDFAAKQDVALILEEATQSRELAGEIADAGVAVIYQLPFAPNRAGVDRGKGADDFWPGYDTPAALVEAGVRIAITSGGSTSDLLFAANAASRNGLDPAAALRAVTLTPAEILGVADRVGSLRAGKDGDLVVLNASPFSGNASVLATWVDGEVAWERPETAAVVIEVEELHVGDGEVLRPGQLLMQDGRIVEVGERVGRPRGARTVRGFAAMPGMIDALGHLGLEGSNKVPSTDFKLATIVAPGDRTDRRVAKAGVTTVVLTPRSHSGTGAPMMAYKPAAADFDGQVVGDPVAVRLQWTDRNRLKSGEDVRGLLEKAKKYRDSWIEYEEAMASWTPPPEEPEEEAKGDEKKDDEKADEEKEEGDDEKDKKKKKKKKDEEEVVEPDPITGAWSAQVARPPLPDAADLRMRLALTLDPKRPDGGGSIAGNLRCIAVSDDLVELEGWYHGEEHTVSMTGLGTQGWVKIEAKYSKQKLEGTITVGANEIDLEAERTSREYVVAERPERRPVEEEKEKEPKGKPKEPRLDEKLEPLRAAMEGKASVLVGVERADEILHCVAAFEEVGIRPVLFGAEDAHKVADELEGRVAGILLAHSMKVAVPKKGTEYRNPYQEIQNAGIPVAFYSSAEEGAADLPLMALYAIAGGMSPQGALRALTADAAELMAVGEHVGRLERGLDADVLLLDGRPLDPGTSVLRTWVNGREVH